MTIWKQSPFYPELGKKEVELPNMVESGPADALISMDGFNVLPDRNGNFVDGGEMNYSEEKLDAIHTFAIIRMVINMYEELLGKPIHWSWWKNSEGEPLTVKITNNGINACFIKEKSCIELDFYGPHGNWIHNCRSVDLVAHETGHAILDSILPHLNDGNLVAEGIGEAFCDLTAIFLVLSQKDLCEHVIYETGGDLDKPSILSLFAVGYGYEKNRFKELRNASVVDPYFDETSSAYKIGQVLTGIFYGHLKELFSKTDQYSMLNNSEKLFLVGKEWKERVFGQFAGLTNEDISYNQFKNKIEEEFQR